ncbi:aminotransferase class III-fold pyridoxal phosphate-dependent enzyme [Streptomyces sp. RB110-1]|uniref:aminotransferase class III-fold pyridoxal phosphate-dependent enzyme n=2 Tax=unclassified Streptomyces TaxID=2593676 RepID=UPI0027DA4721|nr:aminotransferase class III-fold pyridoxal phosphate-dependent enzyme [Streptomyces sp. RB110-1]
MAGPASSPQGTVMRITANTSTVLRVSGSGHPKGLAAPPSRLRMLVVTSPGHGGRYVFRQNDLQTRGLESDASVHALPDLLDRDWTDGEPAYGPRFAARAKGPYVWDADGVRYLDLVLGFGSVVLGHADDAVDRAVMEAISQGVAPTLRTPEQIELTECLGNLVPNAESALLLRTGSDATAAAVRIARAATGRTRVIRHGYQGWHDWCAPRPAGIPPAVRDLTTHFPYNDVAALRRELERHPGDVACVVMMPTETELPQPGFLESCRKLTHEFGALFVLDEVRTGFRLAVGGAQEYFGVDADLVALSKAMANGYAVSAVTGRREIMHSVDSVSASSLFYRSRDGFAAALATLTRIAEDEVVPRLWATGEELMRGLSDAAREAGIPARPIGLAPMPFHTFDVAHHLRAPLHREFYRAAAGAGVLFHPSHHWFVCASMTSAEVTLAVEAAAVGYHSAARLLDKLQGR